MCVTGIETRMVKAVDGAAEGGVMPPWDLPLDELRKELGVKGGVDGGTLLEMGGWRDVSLAVEVRMEMGDEVSGYVTG